MINRRSFVLGSSALFGMLYAPAVVAGERGYNHYVVTQADLGGVKTSIAKTGDTWDSLFGVRANVAQYFNRQNLQIEAGQLLLVPPSGVTTIMSPAMVPFAWAGSNEFVFILVSPSQYAWGLFRGNQLVRWGPAVCGGDWCADVGRVCRSPSGFFPITETAGPKKRSSRYPRELAAEGRGALMPYFMRITDYGVGLHARYMRGRHETHGCIGLFYDDAKWLNLEYAQKHQLYVKVGKYST